MTAVSDTDETDVDRSQNRSASSLDWIDRAKGAGIVLVVLGHALIGAATAGILTLDGGWGWLEQAIYSFHMPLFFLLSGYTFERWAGRDTLAGALWSRVTRLLWPLVLWTYLFLAFRYAAGSAANVETRVSDLLVWPLPPRDHFWFLWALFLIQAALLPLVRAVRPPTAGLAALGLGWLVVISVPGLPLGPWTVDAAVHLSVFIAGMVAGRLTWPAHDRARAIAAAVAFGALVVILVPVKDPVGVTVGLAAILSVLFCLAMTWPGQGSVGRLLARLGTLSMPIYLAHTIFSAGTRTALRRFTDDAAIHLAAATLAGLVGPVVLYYIVRRIMPPRALGF